MPIYDKKVKSVVFIDYMISVFNDALAELIGSSVSVNYDPRKDSHPHFYSLNMESFTKKDSSIQVHKQLRSASASPN